MTYKLLALDLDGTVVLRDGRIDERDRAAIASLHARGVTVTLVTGRLYSGTRDVARELDVRAPIACADGAAIVEPTHDVEIRHLGIAGAAAQQFHQLLRGRGLAVFPLYEDRIVYDERGKPFARYIHNWSPHVEQVDRALDHPCWHSQRGLSAVVVVGDDGVVRATATRLRRGGHCEVFDFLVSRALGGPDGPAVRALLAHAAGVSKGAAVVELAERCGCHPREVVAVGDWLNDASMLRAAGRSFAMGHAPAPVKLAATDRLAATGKTGGGVAEAIAAAWPSEASGA